jgi:hypothetical protein
LASSSEYGRGLNFHSYAILRKPPLIPGMPITRLILLLKNFKPGKKLSEKKPKREYFRNFRLPDFN